MATGTKAVSLTQGFSTATSINLAGSKWNSADLEQTHAGNVTGYTFNAASDLGAASITVEDTHSWKITATTSADTINGGSGNDTIDGAGGADVAFGNDGKDVFTQSVAGKLSAEDYVYGTDKVKSALTFNMADATTAAANFANTGVVFTEAGGSANVSLASAETDGYYKVNVVDGNDKSYNVWFGGANSSTMDASAETTGLYMLGNNNSAADIIYGGTAADTIYAGADDSVDGGAGNDLITLAANSTVVLDSASGKDTVKGFSAGLTGANSTLYVSDTTLASLAATNDGGNVTITDGSSTTLLSNVAAGSGIRIMDSTGTTYNVAIAEDKAASSLTYSANVGAYVGSSSSKVNTKLTANATGTTADAPSVIDLSNGEQGSFGDTNTYYNISNVAATVSNGKYGELIGTTGADTISVTNAGYATVWGGAGNDTITLGASDAGASQVVLVDGDGSDVVKNFNTANDSINIVTDDLASWSRAKGGNLTLTLDDSSKILVAGSSKATDEFTIQSGDTTYVAEIGMDGQKNTLKTSANVGYYYGGNQTDTLSVSTTYTDTEIWLDNRNAKGTVDDPTFSSIEVVDGSGANGSLVIGGAANTDESLVGGQGDTTLWGGVEGNDTLKGGSGATAYLFGIDEGSDVITNTKSTDKVLLYSVADADVASSSLSGSTMTITLTSGDTLTIQGISSNSVNTFELLDGTYTYDYSKRNSYTKGWTWTAGSSY